MSQAPAGAAWSGLTLGLRTVRAAHRRRSSAAVPSWANTICVMPVRYSLSSGPRTLGSSISTSAVKLGYVGKKWHKNVAALSAEVDQPHPCRGEASWARFGRSSATARHRLVRLLPDAERASRDDSMCRRVLAIVVLRILEIDRFGHGIKCTAVHGGGGDIAYVAGIAAETIMVGPPSRSPAAYPTATDHPSSAY